MVSCMQLRIIYTVAQDHTRTLVGHTRVQDRCMVMPNHLNNIKPAGDKIAEGTGTWNTNKLKLPAE